MGNAVYSRRDDRGSGTSRVQPLRAAYSASLSSSLNVGLCLRCFFCFESAWRRVGGGVPRAARAAALAAFVALNGFGFFFLRTA